MARLIDLAGVEEGDQETDAAPESADGDQTDGRPNPNVGVFSAALSCYP